MELFPSTVIRKGIEEGIHSQGKICFAGQHPGLMSKQVNNKALQELLNQALISFLFSVTLTATLF